MSSPRWTDLLWIGYVSTRATLVPAGMGTVALGAACAWLGCGSGCWPVCDLSCARQVSVTSSVSATATPCFAFVTARVRNGEMDETVRERWYIIVHLRTKALLWRFRFVRIYEDRTRTQLIGLVVPREWYPIC